MSVELPLIFLGGLLGSSHCVGMCGGFVVALGGSAENARANLARQTVFSLGRVMTYTTFGAFAGVAGLWVTHRFSAMTWLQAALGILAGVLLILQGLHAAGLLGRKKATQGTCLAAGAFRSLLLSKKLSHALVAGMLTACIPCGLVYAFLALAASAHSLPWGAATMLVFGLGTVPLMMAIGGGVSLMSIRFRQRMLRIAAWCVIITGIMAMARGVYAIPLDNATGIESAPPACPLCAGKEVGTS